MSLSLLAVVLAASSCDQPARRNWTHNLGRIAHGFAGKLDLDLPSLTHDRRLDSIATSCGCLEARLIAGGAPVREGARVAAGAALHLRLRFAPKITQDGPRKETVRLRFGREGGPAETRVLDLLYTADRTQSVVADPSGLQVERKVPVDAFEVVLPLVYPVRPGAVALEAGSWVALVGHDDGSPVEAIRLRVAAIDATGSYEAKLCITLGEGATESVDFRLRAVPPAGYDLSPRRIVLSLPAGGSIAHPVTIRGTDVAFAPERVGWQEDSGLRDPTGESTPGGSHASGHGPRVALVAAPDGPGSDHAARLLFRVGRCGIRGVFKGRALVRPNPTARFRLTLPYTVRVY